ncbi:MAG: RluA family pseudouridine synthase [Bacteriovoracia bacterium]
MPRENATISILFENDDYVVINKPPLLDSQPSKPDRASVSQWLVDHYQFSGLVHRLDFGTSGCMICAKNPTTAATLTQKIKTKGIQRIYRAVVFRPLTTTSGTIDIPIDDRSAKTNYKVVENFAGSSYIEAEILTGRKHQIRRHFSVSGHPVLGDHLYKRSGSHLLFHRPALHAFQLTVDGQKFEAPIPEDLSTLLAELRAIR